MLIIGFAPITGGMELSCRRYEVTARLPNFVEKGESKALESPLLAKQREDLGEGIEL